MKRLAATERVVVKMNPTNPQRVQQPQWRPAMENIGIDVHKKESQLCIITSDHRCGSASGGVSS